MLTDALLCVIVVECLNADMAKLADAPDLGSGSERSEGSSPFIRIASNVLWCSHLGISFNPELTVSNDLGKEETAVPCPYPKIIARRDRGYA